ncbi:MAG: AgmX/PglI C-terminal domain-containing protein, partial [Myxococcota bacterium]|nr:AgmX/PglI C-terminal domain-containing protein [Myxococcota bacterium]
RALGSLRFPSRRADTTLVLDLAFRQAATAPTVDPATAAYRESVVRALESHQPVVHACVQRSRRALESPEGRVLVEMTIAADGRITRAALPSGHLFPQLAECLTRAIPQWRVPRPPTAPFPFDHRFDAQVAAYGD